jgi:hypothetical protein
LRPTFYRGCWHVVSRHLFRAYSPSSSARKALYDPKAFIGHAALLHQACAHCAISLTAASRRSWGRVSVPMWGVTLSGPLPVTGLVGCYPANYLMGRRPLLKQLIFSHRYLVPVSLSGVSMDFSVLSPSSGQVAYVLLTRPPLSPIQVPVPVRLACIRHAASVHPEPGSNSSSILEVRSRTSQSQA